MDNDGDGDGDGTEVVSTGYEEGKRNNQSKFLAGNIEITVA